MIHKIITKVSMISRFWNKLDKINNNRSVFMWFLFIWLILNLLQAFFTDLAHDEAYYWMYSKDLDWGYFDHPPVIALLVKFGYWLFPNELGVRFFTTILGTLVLFIIYQILKKELTSISLLLVLLISTLLIQTHVGGFLAIPDLPLIFFAALFYLLYKTYLDKDTWYIALVLGLVGVAMLYSKYHGVLVLFFTLISNLKILRRLTFYIIPIIIVVAMLPHLMWQIENDFPTFSYHLVGRSSAYSIDRTLNYLVGQLLIAGPLVGIILFYHSIKIKTGENSFLRAMKFNFYGFFGFFLLSSFKGHVEPHWTAIGFIPLIILSYYSIRTSEIAKKWLRILLLPSILMFLFLRVSLVVDLNILPKRIPIVNEFFNWDVLSNQIKEVKGDRKVVFVNSFQHPSKYAFYSGGDFVHVLNSIHYRQNQYDLWGIENEIQNKDVILFNGAKCYDTIKSPVGDFRYRMIDNFVSYYNIKIEIDELEYTMSVNDSILMPAAIVNTRDTVLTFDTSGNMQAPRLCITWHNGEKFTGTKYLQYIEGSIQPGDKMLEELNIVAPNVTGEYFCYISIVNNYLHPSFNSKRIKILVKD